jgi:hypothetical protein
MEASLPDSIRERVMYQACHSAPRDIEAGRHISSDATLELIVGNAPQFRENRLPILASADLCGTTGRIPVAQLVSVRFLQKNELTVRHESREMRIISQDETFR